MENHLLPYENLFRKTEYLEEIPIVVENISYGEFFNEYLSRNQPCVIRNVTKDWHAAKDWVINDKINYGFLYKKYRDSDVLIYNCNKKYFNSHRTSDMKFMEYLVYWESYIKSKYSNGFPLLYLKDWHVLNQHKNDEIYEVPKYFKSDWLNEYLLERGMNDYRFVYMGPRGSWTPFHEDVFTSFSWSANVVGKKMWWLFPPGEEKKVKDLQNNLPFDVLTVRHKAKHFEVIQETGDAIFVPSGWHHQVLNLEDTISINHNWINGCNVKTMWLKLEQQYDSVLKELDDCKDMEDFHQRSEIIFKDVSGVSFDFFYNFIEFIANKRLLFIDNNDALNYEQSQFDLKCICDILKILIRSGKTVFYDIDKCRSLLEIIKIALNDAADK